MNLSDDDQTTMSRCPRCEDLAFERMKTHDACYSCGYSSDFDFEKERQWESNVQFTAWVAKNYRAQPAENQDQIEQIETKRSA